MGGGAYVATPNFVTTPAYYKYKIILKDEVGMAVPISIQIRFLGIRDNHNHYTSLATLAFLDYYRLIDDLFKACYTWSVLDVHVGEIHVLPVSHFIIIDYL